MGAFGSGIPPGRRAAGNGVPARGGAELSPRNIPGLAFWIRADLGLTLASGKVSAWADQSGNGRNLSQGTDANRPTLAASVINGKPVVRFGNGTPSNLYMRFATPWAQSTDCTIYAVVRYVESANEIQRMLFPSAGINGDCLLSWSGANAHKPTFQTDAPNRLHAGQTLTSGSNYLVKWAWHYSGANSSVYVQVNNETEASLDTVTETLRNWDWFGIATDASSFETVSDIAEVVIYGKRLASAEEALFRSYVKSRYAISM